MQVNSPVRPRCSQTPSPATPGWRPGGPPPPHTHLRVVKSVKCSLLQQPTLCPHQEDDGNARGFLGPEPDCRGGTGKPQGCHRCHRARSGLCSDSTIPTAAVSSAWLSALCCRGCWRGCKQVTRKSLSYTQGTRKAVVTASAARASPRGRAPLWGELAHPRPVTAAAGAVKQPAGRHLHTSLCEGVSRKPWA